MSSSRLVDMSLACMTCHAVDSSPDLSRSFSVSSDDGGRCGTVMGCWSRRGPHATAPAQVESASSVGAKVAPAPNVGQALCPRLTRCYAVRRDLFNNWVVNEVETEEGRRLCLNLVVAGRG
eukprot:TRINITY_DN2451_c0_g1_i4.p1 TRINITY_DN2451_c0_g1~~TRINITY_DN2451_c0_g1_i4.p1  ORF type:complete len:121 (-),score=4.79 TRINITY_DN2451_c0_g1_i4:534-896(-)